MHARAVGIINNDAVTDCIDSLDHQKIIGIARWIFEDIVPAHSRSKIYIIMNTK